MDNDMTNRRNRMTRLIHETAKFYDTDPRRRAVEDRACRYLTADGRQCAVGRCMSPWTKNRGGLRGNATMLHYPLKDGWGRDPVNVESVLLPQYRGLPGHFWDGLQVLHDEGQHWDEDGLTEAGEYYYQQLLDSVQAGKYDTSP